MPNSVEKTYAEALFSLITEEKGDKSKELEAVLDELGAVEQVLIGVPDFIKLLNTPTISKLEKQKLVSSAFEGKTSEYTYNFLRVLTDKGRFGELNKINREYRRMYNDLCGIAEIIVTTSQPLDQTQRTKVISKMSEISGKTVKLKEKIDKSIIGGIVIDYGSTRLDGSVKTRLDNLKKDISGLIT